MALTPRLVSGSSAKRPEPSGINATPLVHKNSTGQPWNKPGQDGCCMVRYESNTGFACDQIFPRTALRHRQPQRGYHFPARSRRRAAWKRHRPLSNERLSTEDAEDGKMARHERGVLY